MIAIASSPLSASWLMLMHGRLLLSLLLSQCILRSLLRLPSLLKLGWLLLVGGSLDGGEPDEIEIIKGLVRYALCLRSEVMVVCNNNV